MFYMERLFKCPYSKNPPLPHKIPGHAPVALEVHMASVCLWI